MKKITIFLLILVLLTANINYVFASELNINKLTPNQIKHNEIVQQEKEKVEDLLREIARIASEIEYAQRVESHITLNENSKVNAEDQATLQNSIVDIENQLESLGVKQLSPMEVQMLKMIDNSESMVIPMISVPPSTSNTKWYSNSYYVYRGEGKYEIQDVYAQAMTVTSVLGKRVSGTVQTETQKFIDQLKALASVYAQKAIGLVKIITLMPYELSFGNSKTVQDYQTLYYGDLTNQMCFTYVKFETHSSQRLSLVTNQLYYNIDLNTHWVYNGIPGGYPVNKRGSTASGNYANSSTAVSNYMGATMYDFVTGIDIANYENTIKDRINIYCPTAPGLIY